MILNADRQPVGFWYIDDRGYTMLEVPGVATQVTVCAHAVEHMDGAMTFTDRGVPLVIEVLPLAEFNARYAH